MAETPWRAASLPPQRRFRALSRLPPDGLSTMGGNAFTYINWGRHQAAPEVALSERSRLKYRACQKATPRL
eukprot:5019966-Alexandrium_andersonii.AAC.1